MIYKHKQKELENYQIEQYTRRNRVYIWLVGVVFVLALILSSFAN